jgi:dTDP-4-dehydrorhamnose reductase
LVNSGFSPLVVGADRPVGQHLVRLLQQQDFLCKGVTLESRERLPASSGMPVMILLPSMWRPDDLQHIPYWLELAQAEDMPVILVSSMTVFKAAVDINYSEYDEGHDDSPLALQLLELEQQAKANPRHLIVRQAQGFSLQGGDYASEWLNQMRAEEVLEFDMQRLFNPTPADDIADVVLAMLKQSLCVEGLWGTYHFGGIEPVSSYAFAEALLAEASQYEDLSHLNLRSREGGIMPSIWAPMSNNTLLFHTFGVQPKAWRRGLSRLVRRFYRADEGRAGEKE